MTRSVVWQPEIVVPDTVMADMVVVTVHGRVALEDVWTLRDLLT